MMNKEQIKEYHDKVDDNIRQYGYHVTYVSISNEPSFCYSTGIYKSFGIPEIFISSLPQNLSGELVEKYVSKFTDAGLVQVHKRIHDLSDRFPVYLIDVPTERLKNYVLSSVRVYGNDDYKYIQLIYPDTQGHFPTEEGYDYDQEIFGHFSA